MFSSKGMQFWKPFMVIISDSVSSSIIGLKTVTTYLFDYCIRYSSNQNFQKLNFVTKFEPFPLFYLFLKEYFKHE